MTHYLDLASSSFRGSGHELVTIVGDSEAAHMQRTDCMAEMAEVTTAMIMHGFREHQDEGEPDIGPEERLLETIEIYLNGTVEHLHEDTWSGILTYRDVLAGVIGMIDRRLPPSTGDAYRKAIQSFVEQPTIKEPYTTITTAVGAMLLNRSSAGRGEEYFKGPMGSSMLTTHALAGADIGPFGNAVIASLSCMLDSAETLQARALR